MNKKLKIAYVTGRFPAVSTTFQQNEILGLISAGAEVSVLSCRKATPQEINSVHDFAQSILKRTIYPDYKNTLKGIALCLIKKPLAFAKNILYLLTALVNPLAFPKILAAFLTAFGWYPALSKKDYDWIHADFGQNTATTALVLSKLLNCRFSFKVHAWDIYDHRLFRYDPLKKLKGKEADVIFSEHDYGRKIFLKSMNDHSKKIKVNYSSVRINDFKSIDPVSGSKRFVALGRLVEKKGFDVLINAAEILMNMDKKFVIDIYGYGPKEQSLKRMIREKGLKEVVNLKNKYRNEELPEILSDCLALVVPSVEARSGDMDGVPTVIYEAMALGRAVIASRISGIPEIVHTGDNGYLVEPGDTRQLAEQMSKVLDDPENSFAMGNEGRRLVEKNHNHVFNAKALIEEFNNVEALQV